MATTNGEDPVTPLRTPIIHITSHNDEGKAIVKMSNKNEMAAYKGMRTSHKLVYSAEQLPMDLNDEVDIKKHQELKASGKLSIVKKNGTICRIVDFAPNNKAMMHRTQSLDFGCVLAGEIIMELDDGSQTLMKAGDVAVQRATMHVWKNPSETEWARLLFVLQDCQPLEIGGQHFKEDLGEASHGVFPSSDE
jgi:quercetin dioxygenase-like cupin family protein